MARLDIRFKIRIDDLRGPDIAALLEAHLAHMRSLSPPEQVFALDLDGLRRPEITFWTVWDKDRLAGCGALKELSNGEGEIKSMHTAAAHRGQGIAGQLLTHILATARARGYKRLSLETGSMAGFAPARALYARHGFTECSPFGDYPDTEFSTFMTRVL